MGKLKCLGPCGREFDVIDRLKAFGTPGEMLKHICIDCREEMKRDKLKLKERVFNQSIKERSPISKEQTRAAICKKASAFVAFADKMNERKLQKEIDEAIGL
jgi:hypothetical protein